MNTKLIILKTNAMAIASKNREDITLGITTPLGVIDEFIASKGLESEEGLVEMLQTGDWDGAFDYALINLSQGTFEELGEIKNTLDDVYTTLCANTINGFSAIPFDIKVLQKIHEVFIINNKKTLIEILLKYLRNKGIYAETHEDLIKDEIHMFFNGEVYYDSIDADEIIKRQFGILTDMTTQMFIENLLVTLSKDDKDDMITKMIGLIK